jgi:hypothetical protein
MLSVRTQQRVETTLGWECKEPNVIREVTNYTEHAPGCPQPGLFAWAEDVIVEGMKASCRLGAWSGLDCRNVKFC